MIRILATSQHTGGVNAIAPVIRRLRGDGIDVRVVAHKTSEKIFLHHGIAHVAAQSYGITDVSSDSMHAVLEEEKPDLVLTGPDCQDADNPHVIAQSTTLAAGERGIPTLCVNDFWTNRVRYFSDMNDPDGRFTFLPDKLTTIDAYARRILLDDGFPEERIVVTGNPHFDSLIEEKERFTVQDRRSVRKDLGLPLDAYVIMFASQPIEFHFGDSLGYTEKTALIECLDAVGNLQSSSRIAVLVKLHPAEKWEPQASIARNFFCPTAIDKDYPIRRAILASDIIVSPYSTALVESTYMDKPSVSLQPGLADTGKDFLVTNYFGVTVPVYKNGEFQCVLDRLMHDDAYQKELAGKRATFRTDGKATERVVELVYNMLKL